MEKIARFPGGEKIAESCQVSGCHGFWGALIGTEFGEGYATKQKSVKRSAFSLNEGTAFSE